MRKSENSFTENPAPSYDLIPCRLPGVYTIQTDVIKDLRGVFVKTFHAAAFQSLGLRNDFVEEYYSISGGGVLRGMHFQLPPYQHDKLVYCLAGNVLDVIVDLRSTNYGQFEVFELNGNLHKMVYVPEGCAHGFLVTNESAIMVYKTTSLYTPSADAGIRWDSFGFKWPVAQPILSARDAAHPTLTEFQNPF